MVEDGRRLASMDFYDIITSFSKTKMLVVESFSSKDDSTIVNLFFSAAQGRVVHFTPFGNFDVERKFQTIAGDNSHQSLRDSYFVQL